MLALPEPVRGGKVDELRAFLNVTNEQWPLLVCSLISAFRPVGPYPIIWFHGEPGACKSFAAEYCRKLIDPNDANLRDQPKDLHNFAIAATNSWVVAFDNISSFPDWLSDAMCRLSTGAGQSTRQLYTDDEEKIFSYSRLGIVAAVQLLATKSDFLDRAVPIELQPVLKRRDGAEIDAAFNDARPRILGALLDAVVVGLRELPDVEIDRLPRLAGFTKWAVACEVGLGLEKKSFLKAYVKSYDDMDETLIDSSPVGKSVRKFMTGRGEWEGSATELLKAIEADLKTLLQGAPLPDPTRLGGQLRDIAPCLRRKGIDVRMGDTRSKDKRIIKIVNSSIVLTVVG
jgi:hypothetical protein